MSASSTPYHDEIGRFTSPPGVTVSYGKRGGPTPAGRRSLGRREDSSTRPNTRRNERARVGKTPDADGDETSKNAHATNEAVNAAIQAAWKPAAPIASHFDLKRRQKYLDALRRKAGPNASELEKAVFEETQRRLDAARARLSEGDRIADREIVKIARAALPPVDTGLSAISILSGEGDLGDALTVASSVPIVGAAGKFGKFVLPGRIASEVSGGAAREIVQLGGPYWKVRRAKPKGYQPHHIPPDSVNGLRYGEGPTIAMRTEHHKRTASHSSMPGSRDYLARQRALVKQGKFREAVEMDIKDIRNNYGDAYDDAIAQMLQYIEKKGY
ncbi:hypothetical protein KRR38_23795 [Novosphingobium sp. G106]|uniref:hypothetical protein n=1 Tax=Novosphingobium sp. G106 TaxID=2849500 RepID=UPI001C2D8DD4|nr:hypothetical protein [Novosphingobium sp. G106]MBV1690617.1 hypothetical protein [Novosphingobium sp. G106]